MGDREAKEHVDKIKAFVKRLNDLLEVRLKEFAEFR
jgi:hypothetical protein